MVLLHGILKRAKRKGWVATNAAEEAERVTVKRSGDFTVLTPEEVHAVARAAKSDQDAAIFVTAAFAGLRLGELRALRWQDVDFGKRIIHVRRGFVAGNFDVPKSRKVRSVPMVDQVMAALDGLSRRDLYTRLEDLVFPNLFGDPFNDIAVRKRFYAALKQGGARPPPGEGPTDRLPRPPPHFRNPRRPSLPAQRRQGDDGPREHRYDDDLRPSRPPA